MFTSFLKPSLRRRLILKTCVQTTTVARGASNIVESCISSGDTLDPNPLNKNRLFQQKIKQQSIHWKRIVFALFSCFISRLLNNGLDVLVSVSTKPVRIFSFVDEPLRRPIAHVLSLAREDKKHQQILGRIIFLFEMLLNGITSVESFPAGEDLER